MSEQDGMNVTEAAAFLGVSRTTVYAMLKAGRLPHVLMGTQPHFSRTVLAIWQGGAQMSVLMARVAVLAASAAPTTTPTTTPTTAPTTPPGRLTPKHIGGRRRTAPLRIAEIASRRRPEATTDDLA